MATNRKLARRHLDTRFRRMSPLANEAQPHRGWIRAIRDALGMSSPELARRMGMSQSTVAEFEHSELQGTIKLETLRRTADALNCDLVYFLLPRTSLEEVVRQQARLKAVRHLERVSHHSRLEDQIVTSESATAQTDELAAQLIDKRGLWSDSDEPR